MSKGDRKLSIVDKEDLAWCTATLEGFFNTYKSGSGKTEGVTSADLERLCTEKGILDGKLTAKVVSSVFAKVKLARKKQLKLMQFTEAWRQLGAAKGVTYFELTKLASGDKPASSKGAGDEGHMEIDANISKISIEDFDIIKVLGKGSFGKVMLVKKKDSSEVLAMKTMRKKMLVKRKQIGHTQTERRIAQNLKSPFLVNLRYAFQTQDKLYLVLDYCSGGELFFWLRQHRRFSQPRVKLYCAQMTSALEVMHNADIIYRGS